MTAAELKNWWGGDDDTTAPHETMVGQHGEAVRSRLVHHLPLSILSTGEEHHGRGRHSVLHCPLSLHSAAVVVILTYHAISVPHPPSLPQHSLTVHTSHVWSGGTQANMDGQQNGGETTGGLLVRISRQQFEQLQETGHGGVSFVNEACARHANLVPYGQGERGQDEERLNHWHEASVMPGQHLRARREVAFRYEDNDTEQRQCIWCGVQTIVASASESGVNDALRATAKFLGWCEKDVHCALPARWSYTHCNSNPVSSQRGCCAGILFGTAWGVIIRHHFFYSAELAVQHCIS